MNSRTRRTKFKPYPAVPELAAPTFTVPPAGKCPTLSREPTLAWAFSLKFSFWFSILTSPPPGTRLRRAEFINASRRVPLQIRLQTGETQVGNFHPCGHTGLRGKALEVPSGGDSHTPYRLPTVCIPCQGCHQLSPSVKSLVLGDVPPLFLHRVPLLTMPTPTPSPAVARLPALAAPSPTHRPLCHCLPALRGWQCQQGEAKLGKWREASGSREPEGQ